MVWVLSVSFIFTSCALRAPCSPVQHARTCAQHRPRYDVVSWRLGPGSSRSTSTNTVAHLGAPRLIPLLFVVPFWSTWCRSCQRFLPVSLNNYKLQSNQMLYYVECHNTVFCSKLSAICAQAVYFLHSTTSSVTCLRLSDVSVICRVTYFAVFQSRPAFLPCRSARRYSGVVDLPNIGHRTLRKIWVGFLYGVYSPVKWFWVDSSNGKNGN